MSEFKAILSGTPLEDCFEFWRSVRGDGGVPPKAMIDPVAMPRHIIPYLFMHERTPEGRFRCRLSGTALCTVFQIDVTGMHLDETMPPDLLAGRLRMYQGVLDRAQPVVFAGNVADTDRNWIKFCRLMMPISIKGQGPDGIFGMVIFPGFDQGRPGGPRRRFSPPVAEAWATPEDLVGR